MSVFGLICSLLGISILSTSFLLLHPHRISLCQKQQKSCEWFLATSMTIVKIMVIKSLIFNITHRLFSCPEQSLYVVACVIYCTVFLNSFYSHSLCFHCMPFLCLYPDSQILIDLMLFFLCFHSSFNWMSDICLLGFKF